MPISTVLVTALACYFLGNHNGAICVSHMLHDDVRDHGSGNAGLTNFIRYFGAHRSVLVIAIDVLKAILACWLGREMFTPYGYGLEGAAFGGLCLMLGHDFPALLGFRGGKGILSGWFIAFSIDWRVGLLIAVVFFSAYLSTQYVSLGSVLAAAAFGIGFLIFHRDNPTVLFCTLVMSGLTIFMHRGNILRLVKGQERKTNLLGKGKAQ
ncbi:MAG: glycerol-3-phosphate acyltransferase [Clostridia bacterium]|nr:glycerol-3-phosphate acyltransferase [Oscillospiraceae bacterium]MBR6573548.1 glycerol-3-phosphate acyltransferase [Clostridia bacterium]